jgi:hypothetical protein
MRKAQFILFSDKNDSQLREDMALSPERRFKKMFMLISMALFLSPNKKIKNCTDNRFIELRRKEDDTTTK